MSTPLASWFRSRDAADGRCATVAVARDACGIVLLASPDGEHYRCVDRLALTATEAEALYNESAAPTLSAQDLERSYGQQIAKLQLEQM